MGHCAGGAGKVWAVCRTVYRLIEEGKLKSTLVRGRRLLMSVLSTSHGGRRVTAKPSY